MAASISGSVKIDFHLPTNRDKTGNNGGKRQLKVLFIYPNFPMSHLLLPAGVSILSACVKQAGHDTRLFDTTLYKPEGKSMDDLRIELLQLKKVSTEERSVAFKTTDMLEDFQQMLREYQPDLVAASLLEDTFPIALPLMRVAHDAGIPVVAGGIYPTFAPEDVINEASVDIVCRGEGEVPMVELCHRLATGASFDRVANLWIKKPDGTILKNHMGPTVNVDELPFPDYDIFESQRFFRPMQGSLLRIMPIEMHRGCPYQCAFCEDPIQSKMYREIGERYHRAKNPKKLIEELRILVDKYQAEYIYFNAETFFAMPDRYFVELAHRYAEEIGLPFWMQTRPETLTDKHVELLKEMNVAHINIGIEHGNEEFRANVLKRNMSNELIINGLKNLHQAGIPTTVNNIMGFPDETRELVFDTIEVNRHIQSATINAYLFNPYKGTELYDVCQEKGYLPDESDEKIVDSFLSEDFPYFKSMLKMPTITREDLMGLQRTFVLYAKLPRSEFPRIRIAEKFDEEGNAMFRTLREEFLSGQHEQAIADGAELLMA